MFLNIQESPKLLTKLATELGMKRGCKEYNILFVEVSLKV